MHSDKNESIFAFRHWIMLCPPPGRQHAYPRPLPSVLRSGLFQVGKEKRPDFLRGLVFTFLQAPLSPFFLLQVL